MGELSVDKIAADTSITFNEVASQPTPAAGEVRVYAKDDGLVYSKDSAGTETLLTGGLGGAGTLAATLAAGSASGGTNLLITSGDVIDAATAVPLVLGSATATSVTIGASDAPVSAPGWLNVGAPGVAATSVGWLAAGNANESMRFTNSLNLWRASATVDSGSVMNMRRSRGTLASPSAVQDGDAIGALSSVGYNGSAYSGFSSIRMLADGAPTSGTSSPGKIQFMTTPQDTIAVATRWEMLEAGHFIAPTDNTLDIGAAGATRPRTGYFGTSLLAGAATLTGTTLDATGSFTIGGTSATAIAIGRSGITTDFPSGSTVDFTGATVTGLSAGAAETLAATLAAGNSTGGTNLDVTSGDVIDSATGVPLVIGPTTATSVTLSKASAAVNVAGSMNVGTPGLAFTTTGWFTAGDAIAQVDHANGQWTVRRGNAGADTGGVLQGKRSRGTIASPTAVQDGDGIAIFGGVEYHGSGFANAAQIRILADGAPTSGTSSPGKIQFMTTPQGTIAVVARWEMLEAGHFIAPTDNTLDVGASGANRPRTIHVGTSIVTAGASTLTGTTLDATGGFAIGGTSATSLAIGRSGVTTDFPSGSTVDFTGATVTGLSLSTETLAATLTAGNSTGGTNLLVTSGDVIDSATAVDLVLGSATATGVTVGRSGIAVTIPGDLVVQGTTTSVLNENVQTRDNHLYMNMDYVTVSGQTGGLALNYLPTSTVDTEAAGGFTSTTAVATTAAAAFAAGDFVQVSGAANPANDGIYEVLTHATNVLTIDSTPTHRLANTAFTVDATGSTAAFTKVNLSVMQATTAGVWQVGLGATASALTSSLADVSSVSTLADVLSAGNTTSGSNISVTTGDSILGAAELTIAASSGVLDLDATAAVSINSSAGVINVGNDAVSQNINIGTAGTRVITVGSATANVTLAGELRGTDDGTGIVIGHVPTGASTGSAPQVASYTTTEKNNLVEADGMVVLDETLNQLQGRVNNAWINLGADSNTGTVSRLATLPQDITAVTAPSEITLGSGTSAQSFPDGSTTGQRFEVKVPEDYNAGDLTVNIVYSMSTAVASPNNVVRLEIAAEIADVSGGSFDTATYAAANFDITVPDNSTNITRSLTITISEGDFGSGDSIAVLFKRLGGDGADVHTGALQVIAYDYAYLAQVASRDVMQVVSIFDDTDETATSPRSIDGTAGSFDTLEYLTAIDDEQKFEVAVPDNWDGSSPLQVSVVSKMSTGAAAVVELELVAEIADVSGGSLVTDGPRTYLLTPPATTDLFRSATVFEIPANLLGLGDVLSIKLARRGTSGSDTHGGTFVVLSAIATTASTPKDSFAAVSVESHYMPGGKFKIVSGAPTGVEEDPALAGDFEHWLLMTGTAASDRIDIQFQGRLMSSQTQITSIVVPLKGTGEYQIKVFTEANGATNQYTASALTAAPGTRTLISILAAGLTNQPSLAGSNEGRFHVVVEATLDNTEVLRVGRPYVTQE